MKNYSKLLIECCVGKIKLCGQFHRASNIYGFHRGGQGTFEWCHVQGHEIKEMETESTLGFPSERMKRGTIRIFETLMTQNDLADSQFTYGLHLCFNGAFVLTPQSCKKHILFCSWS